VGRRRDAGAAQIRERFDKEEPLQDIRIAACLHVTTENREPDGDACGRGRGGLARGVEPAVDAGRRRGRAHRAERVETFAIKGEDNDTYYKHLNAVLDLQAPGDDGRRRRPRERAAHAARRPAHALCSRDRGDDDRRDPAARDGRRRALGYPIVSGQRRRHEHLFDNRFGTGQSTIDAVMRSTNRLLAGKTIVVAGYGMCGRGVASRARGHGAHVVVTEVDPTVALEAFDGGLPRDADARRGADRRRLHQRDGRTPP
jgi:adenosylhomocysteinase